MTVGQLRGFAWGSGPALGWITFGGPILKNVVDKGAYPTNSAKRQVELTWDNPIGYSKVEIWRKEDSGNFESIETFGQGTTQVQPGQGKTAIVDGLKANTNYQFYVRGYLW
jgi:hypothetical protein